MFLGGSSSLGRTMKVAASKVEAKEKEKKKLAKKRLEKNDVGELEEKVPSKMME
jgi:hypothetical protein